MANLADQMDQAAETEKFEMEPSNEALKTEVSNPDAKAPESPKEDKAPDTQIAASSAPAEKKSEAKASDPMALDAKGLMQPANVTELWRIAKMLLTSKALPKHFENAEQVVMAFQFLKSRGLDPFVAIRQTMMVNGVLNIWGDLPLACVRQSGLMEDFEELVFDKDYKAITFSNKNLDADIYGAVCMTRRKGCPAIERSFTIDEAKTAGLIDKEKSLYKKWLRRMIQMRARAFCLKDAYPDVLAGIPIAEYDHFTDPSGEYEAPPAPKTLAQQMNERFLEAPQENGDVL